MLRFVSKNALLLGGAAAICVAALSTINQLTGPEIARQTELEKLRLLQEVLPQGAATPALLDDCVLLNEPEVLFQPNAKLYRWRPENQTAAFVVETTAPDGYSGNIQLLAAIDLQGTVLAVRVLSHKETPGLGDKIETRKGDWIHSLAQQQVQGADDKRFAVKKDGGQFDQFAGATITPRAVIAAVKRTALYLKQHPELMTLPSACNNAAQ